MMLVPSQATPTEPVKLNTIRATGGESIFHACAKKLTNDELLISRLAGSRLKMELDRVPLWKDDRVQVTELAEYFARYAYLPRLTNPKVLRPLKMASSRPPGLKTASPMRIAMIRPPSVMSASKPAKRLS